MKVRLAIHCVKCINEMPHGVSPKTFSRQQVLLMENGDLVAWCNRHEMVIGPLTIEGKVDPKLLAAECQCCVGGKHVGG